MRVAIVGSRDYPHLERAESFVDSLPRATVVVSGAARGVDTIAEVAARSAGLAVSSWPANWAEQGRGAGYARNHDIIRDADLVVAFWDGRSRGTQHSIRLAKEYSKVCVVVPA